MDEGEIRTFNASQGIAQERDLPLIIWHTNAMRQARTGEIIGQPNVLSDNQKKMNRVRALNDIISAQEELISTFRAQIKARALSKWRKDYKEEEEQEKNPFEKHNNDYNKLRIIREKLDACRMDILEAEKTKAIDDDFLIEKQDLSTGEKYFELTANFYEMIKELEDSFEEINMILLINKCISAGIEEDEELTYKQKEEEVIKRIVEA